jgi:RNA polymerase sigma-70 factor (ECF subfamily)
MEQEHTMAAQLSSPINGQSSVQSFGQPTGQFSGQFCEQALIQQVRGGDQAAYAELVGCYQKPVYHLCLRMLGDAGDAEDAAQETFLRAYLQLATYDASRSFKTWLMAIASHYCIDRLRRKRVKLLSLDDEPLVQVLGLRCPSALPEEVALHGEQASRMQRALTHLPAETRKVVALRYWGDYSCEEIAEATGSSVNAVKSRLHRARAALANLLGEDEYAAMPSM